MITHYQHKAVFLDKDGTLIPDIPYNVNVDLIQIESEAIKGLKLLKEQEFLLVVVSNQSGIARGYFSEANLDKVWQKISDLLQPHQLSINGYYYCPHHPEGKMNPYAMDCDCRKPLPGLIFTAAAKLNVDLSQSWMIGDILNDVEAGKRAGCRTVLLDKGNETEWILNEWRTPDFTAPDFYTAALIIKENSQNTVHERVDRL
jgi:D-glycero-D-manno-heptose 1,7-bisphosphate phosphatase